MRVLLTHVNDMKAGQGRLWFQHILLLCKIIKCYSIIVIWQINALIKLCDLVLGKERVLQFLVWKAKLFNCVLFA